MKLAPETGIKAAEREILGLAAEDFQGLWEVRSQVEGVLGRRGPRVRRVVADAVRDLLARRWVRLYRAASGRWAGATPLAEAEAAAVLGDPRAWDLPAGDAGQLLIAVTPEGERAYMSRALDG